jgi:hypothetical protein
MNKMDIALWSDFKSLIASKALMIQYSDLGDKYDIYAPEAQTFLWHTFLSKDGGTDVTDFETNYKAKANAPLEVKAGTGRPVRYSNSPQPLNTYNKWKGYQAILAPGSTFTFVDIQFASAIYFRGGYVYTNDADLDDTVSADVLLATNDSVLMPKMIDSVSLSSGILLPFMSDESMQFPNYYKLRISFYSPDGISQTERYHNVMLEYFQ